MHLMFDQLMERRTKLKMNNLLVELNCSHPKYKVHDIRLIWGGGRFDPLLHPTYSSVGSLVEGEGDHEVRQVDHLLAAAHAIPGPDRLTLA